MDIHPKRKRGRPAKKLPIVAGRLVRCPKCNGEGCPTIRTLARFVGYVRQVRKCKTCGTTFEAIFD